jgi:hypothetical protein
VSFIIGAIRSSHSTSALSAQTPWSDFHQIHAKTQTLHLQQAKSFFRTSSPLIHNQGSAKLGNSAVNLKHARRIQAALEPPAQGNVNKLFKHANACEIKSQSIEFE